MGGPREEARDAQAEIGWIIAPVHAGRGHATELACALLDLAFTGLSVRPVEAHAFTDNAPILRVMEKVGLRHEGTFKEESLHRTRGWVDGVTDAMLASEHRARGRRLSTSRRPEVRNALDITLRKVVV
ncbi:GNAT family N-acetyltransferase [Micrococcus luteus]|uniref:GNAT family N-acetyltransferase n=1 Tax=Micrococcus TaxID=1269 RepID=UPI001F495433|nr:GNAT family protein [Micrococcus sp. KRD128]